MGIVERSIELDDAEQRGIDDAHQAVVLLKGVIDAPDGMVLAVSEGELEGEEVPPPAA